MTFRKIVVTGASGFLGGRTLKAFKSFYPNAQIVGTGRRSERKTEFESLQCDFESGDLLQQSFCDHLCESADLIIHCAALSSPWGSYEKFYNSNVQATENLLEAAQRQRVSKFIFISTPSIYFTHNDRFLIHEDHDLPSKLVNNYALTKLAAEKKVLTLNGNQMQTLALRPRAIIGAEDTVIMPRVLKAYEEGKLKIVGNGKNVVDLTCVSNVVEAIRCGVNASEDAYGQAYNITDGNPISLWQEINYMLQELELNQVEKKIPLNVARFAAKLSENWARLTNKDEPTLTDYGIGILARNFTLDIAKAKEKLDYSPISTTREGIDEFINWYKKSMHD